VHYLLKPKKQPATNARMLNATNARMLNATNARMIFFNTQIGSWLSKKLIHLCIHSCIRVFIRAFVAIFNFHGKFKIWTL